MFSLHVVQRRVGAVLTAAALGAAAPAVLATEVADTLTRAAAPAARPEQSVLLSVASAGPRLVAVGERGLIVVSDDQGKSWRQVPVPLSVTLTAVSFPSASKGWAVGHRGVILATSDGGSTWVQQLNGVQFAERALAQAQVQAKDVAQAASPAASAASAAVNDAQALVRDRADKPFLDVSFTDEQHGFAVGAYGLCATTQDGGKAWSSCMAQLPNPKGAHLYSIARSGTAVYIAGEQGVVLRSDDGVNYSAVPGPYTASLFCVGVAGNGDVVLGGLRGVAFVSTDQGHSFQALASGSQGSFSGAARLNDGRLAFANQLGQVLQYDTSSRRLKLVATPPLAPLSGLTQTSAGTLAAVGVRGAVALPTPPAPASSSAKP